MGGGPYYNIVSGARIADSSRVDQSGSDDNNVTNWTVGNDFILAVHQQDNSKDTEAGTYKLQWRNVTDSGSFADLASTGELNFTVGGATALTDGNACTPSNWKCTDQGRTDVNGTEREDSNATVAFDGRDGDETEHQWAISTDSAGYLKEYAFQLVDTANGDRTDAINVTITTADIGGLGVSVADTISFSDTLTDRALPLPMSIADAISFLESISGRFSDLQISASDSVTITDVIQALASIEPNVSDTVSLSDAVQLAVGVLVSASDTITFSEALSAIISDLAINASDNFGFVDIASAAVEGLGAPAFNISDQLGFLESLQASMLLAGVGVSDTMAFAEFIASRIGIELNPSDQLALAESVGLGVELSAAPSDTVGISDSLQAGVSVSTTPTPDTFGLSELVSLFMALGGIEVSDQFDLTELISGSLLIPGITISDSFGFSESVSVSVVTPPQISVLIGIHDGKVYLRINSVVTEL